MSAKSIWDGCDDPAARAEIAEIMRQHGLVFTYNPGGGEFFNRDRTFRCQIAAMHDRDDLAKLRAAVSHFADV